MIRFTLPNGEDIELRDPYLEQAMLMMRREREDLVDVLLALYRERNPQTLREAESILRYHRRL